MAPKKKKSGRKKTGRKKKTGQKGKGFLDNLISGVRSVASIAKPLLSVVPHPGAQAAARTMGALGLGRRRKTATKTKSLRRLMGGAAKGIRPMRPTLMGAGAKKSLYTE